MNRWKVKQIYSHFYDRGMWEVHNTEGIYGSYLTHAEAIADADRMARTVEVELPREVNRAGRYTLRSHQYGIQIRHKKWPKKRGEMTIAHTDVKDLALALLAHHYRAVDNPQ